MTKKPAAQPTQAADDDHDAAPSETVSADTAEAPTRPDAPAAEAGGATR